MYSLEYKNFLEKELGTIESQGLFKRERVLQSPQGNKITVNNREVLNFCANNYLGLSGNHELIQAAHEGLDKFGYGLSSVRFICGTQSIHKTLEAKVSTFLQKEDCILFSSCFDANGAVFEALLGEQDAVISDELNHASIIDGIRLCKANRYRYKNRDLYALEEALQEAQKHRFRLIVTDGVFSMDGFLAPLKEIAALAEKYNSLLMVDDSHATGFIGEHGRGSGEHDGVLDKIDIISSTFGKALGGSGGGFVSGKKEIIEMLRQRARPYLFSNTLTPPIAYASVKALDLVSNNSVGGKLRKILHENTKRFRQGMEAAGFHIIPGFHPITPVMLGDARLAQTMASDLLEEGIYVIGFFYPVVPKEKARIRVQISAAHTSQDIDQAIAAFTKIGKRHRVV